MRAVVQDRYGPPEVLRVAEVDRPRPEVGEILVRVNASSVTRSDTGLRSLEYPFSRLLTGVRRPTRTIAGMEFAGVVDEVGAGVTEFSRGDEVFGIGWGANAEYVTVGKGCVIARKPAGLTFEQAAAVPDGSLLALTCLRPAEPLHGKRVLVYGAAGSIGTAAVQLLAHHFEADVTAVCDTKAVESCGRWEHARCSIASATTSRRTARPTTSSSTRSASTRSAAAGARSSPVGRTSRPTSGSCTTSRSLLVTRFVGSKRARLAIGRYRTEDLLLVKELVEAGKYRPVIDRTYALDEVVEATRYVETGQKTGNVVLRVSEPASAAAPEPRRHARGGRAGLTPTLERARRGLGRRSGSGVELACEEQLVELGADAVELGAVRRDPQRAGSRRIDLEDPGDADPGRGLMTTIRSARSVASWIECVTNTIVFRSSLQIRWSSRLSSSLRQRVERRERLVHQEDRWIVDERSAE